MSEVETQAPPPDVNQVKPKRKKAVIITAAVVTAALAAAGAIVTPMVIHQAQVREYHDLVTETNALLEQAAADVVAAEALEALHMVQEDRAHEFAASVVALGGTAAPILTADTAAAILAAGTDLQEALGERTPIEGNVLQVAHLARIEQDQATADGLAAIAAAATAVVSDDTDDDSEPGDDPGTGDDADAGEFTPMVTDELLLTVNDVTELLELAPAPLLMTPLSDDQVDGDAVSTATLARDEAMQHAERVAKLRDRAQAKLDQLHTLIGATYEPLEAAFDEAEPQSSEVLAAATKASEAQRALVTTTATAKIDDQGDALEPLTNLVTGLQAYVDAAKAAQAAHAQVLADEAAAAAAAAGESGYTDPSTGTWTPTPGYSGGGWSGGGSSGGGSSSGGGWSGGGSDGGSSSGGGSSGGGSDGGSSSGGGTDWDHLEWLKANCQWGYNFWGTGGECYPAPDLDDDW